MTYKPRTNYKGPAIERIEAARTITEAGCWETPFTPALRYPMLSHQGRCVRVHQYIYQLEKGQIPPGQFVCHTCNNPRCHNPDHLYLGTPSQNAQDCVKRGRHPKKHSWETLSKIFALREIGRLPGNEIARILGLSGGGVNQILREHGMSFRKGGYHRYSER